MRTSFLSLLSLGLSLVSLVSAGTYDSCQANENACPAGTILVTKVAQLEAAIANPNAKLIRLASGTYTLSKQLKISSSVTMIGATGGEQPRIEGADASVIGGTKRNFQSAVVYITGSATVSIYNIVMANTYDDRKEITGPAAALFTDKGTKVGLYGVGLEGWQDTFYVGGVAIMIGGYITGAVDQLYGRGYLYMRDVELRIRLCGGAIVAWDSESQSGGAIVIEGGEIVRASDNRLKSGDKCYLARAWRPLSVVTYLNVHMGNLIDPKGWRRWISNVPDTKVTYREYPKVEGRDKSLGKALSDEEAAKINPTSFFKGQVDWIDGTFVRL